MTDRYLDDDDRAAKKSVKKEQKFEAAKQFQIDAALKDVLSRRDGRELLWWLLGECRVGGQPHTGNALQTSFNCGELNVGNKVLARIIEVEPAGYVRMMQEQADERRQRDNANNRDDGDDN